MLSVKQVAQRLGVCNMTVYRLIRSDDLPAIKVGGLYRIEEKSYQAYLEKGRTGGKSDRNLPGQS